MQCPNCAETLLMSDRQGIEIDYCPKCRGIWLDRGELDKIIEREGSESVAQPAQRHVPEEVYRSGPRYSDDHHHRQGKYHKKKSLLGELFDF